MRLNLIDDKNLMRNIYYADFRLIFMSLFFINNISQLCVNGI